MKNKTNPHARRMWANYYPENPQCLMLHKSRKGAKHCLAPGATHAAIPVAVIPLDDVDALVAAANDAYDTEPTMSSTNGMIAALAAIGVLPRAKGGRK